MSGRRTHRPRPAKPARLVPAARAAAIDYRDPATLRPYLTARGAIRPRRATGLSRVDQARLARAVKRARELALLPYRTAETEPTGRERRRER